MAVVDAARRVESRAASSTVATALRLWGAGDFSGCLHELSRLSVAQHTSESALVRGRALLRLNRVGEAEDWLRVTEDKHSTNDAIATHAMLSGSAAGRLNKADAAHRFFERARLAKPHKSIRAELAYYRALADWQAGDVASARAALASAIDPSNDIIHARALSLSGWTYVAEQRYEEGADRFAVALSALRHCRNKDHHLYATMLHALAISAAELASGDPEPLEREVAAFEWTTSELLEHFQTLRHLGLAFSRRGRIDDALRYFVEA